jgi:two-component system response regulator MprA
MLQCNRCYVDARILIVDGDTRALDAARRELVGAGWSVVTAHDGEAGLLEARHGAYDLVILEADLGGLDGLEVCRRLRAEGFSLPLLLLSSRAAVSERVAGLDAGADEYLIKPWASEELLARVRALLRRYRGSFDGQLLRLADLTMNTATREVRRGGRLLSLTAREFDLLELFLRHPRQVLTRSIIYDHVWGFDFSGESNSVEVYVRYLRGKLEARGERRLLQTVRGVGYALREE